MNANTYEPVEILYAEDSPTDAEVTLRALKKANLCNQIVWVRDGVEALDFLYMRGAYAQRAKGAPRIVLLDLKMPRVDGIEVLRQIRADQQLAGLPVVILTSSAEEADIVRSYNLRVNSYIVKPIDFHTLSDHVARLGYYWLMMNRGPEGN